MANNLYNLRKGGSQKAGREMFFQVKSSRSRKHACRRVLTRVDASTESRVSLVRGDVTWGDDQSLPTSFPPAPSGYLSGQHNIWKLHLVHLNWHAGEENYDSYHCHSSSCWKKEEKTKRAIKDCSASRSVSSAPPNQEPSARWQAVMWSWPTSCSPARRRQLKLSPPSHTTSLPLVSFLILR